MAYAYQKREGGENILRGRCGPRQGVPVRPTPAAPVWSPSTLKMKLKCQSSAFQQNGSSSPSCYAERGQRGIPLLTLLSRPTPRPLPPPATDEEPAQESVPERPVDSKKGDADRPTATHETPTAATPTPKGKPELSRDAASATSIPENVSAGPSLEAGPLMRAKPKAKYIEVEEEEEMEVVRETEEEVPYDSRSVIPSREKEMKGANQQIATGEEQGESEGGVGVQPVPLEAQLNTMETAVNQQLCAAMAAEKQLQTLYLQSDTASGSKEELAFDLHRLREALGVLSSMLTEEGFSDMQQLLAGGRRSPAEGGMSDEFAAGGGASHRALGKHHHQSHHSSSRHHRRRDSGDFGSSLRASSSLGGTLRESSSVFASSELRRSSSKLHHQHSTGAGGGHHEHQDDHRLRRTGSSSKPKQQRAPPKEVVVHIHREDTGEPVPYKKPSRVVTTAMRGHNHPGASRSSFNESTYSSDRDWASRSGTMHLPQRPPAGQHHAHRPASTSPPPTGRSYSYNRSPATSVLSHSSSIVEDLPMMREDSSEWYVPETRH